MRIQVLFNETSVLVPCGAGTISVKELVDKAIVRYKKVLKVSVCGECVCCVVVKKFALWWPNEWALWFFSHLFLYNGFLIKDSVLLVGGGYHGYLLRGL